MRGYRWCCLPGKTDPHLYRRQDPDHGRIWIDGNITGDLCEPLRRKRAEFGTVGPLIDGVEVKIAEDGEILCKGPNVMMGYYKRPDLTAQDITDGWYHTGDIGILNENKFLKITDRKKELFKTSGGKYVAPLPIENKLKESPFIEQVMLVGAERKFVSALIVPSFPNLRDWARKNNITDESNDELTTQS